MDNNKIVHHPTLRLAINIYIVALPVAAPNYRSISHVFMASDAVPLRVLPTALAHLRLSVRRITVGMSRRDSLNFAVVDPDS